MIIGFENQTAVITGAAHGFGRAIARGFADRGAVVHICDINAEGLEETRDLCGSGCHIHVFDIGDAAAIRDFGAALAASDTAPGILVNNAGGVRGQVGRPIEEITPEDWQTIFDVNLSGAFFMTQALAPGMKRRKYGRIVNISSGAGLGISLTGIQAYASAKAGQIGLTRQLAHELGAWNITVNNVAPGFVRSNPTTEKQWDAMGKDGQQKLLDNIALKRLGHPDDIANAVMFFASRQAGWISGQVLSVDGGK